MPTTKTTTAPELFAQGIAEIQCRLGVVDVIQVVRDKPLVVLGSGANDRGPGDLSDPASDLYP